MIRLNNLRGMGARKRPGVPTPPTTEQRYPIYDPLAAPYVNNPYLVPGLTDPDDPESKDDSWVQNPTSIYFLQVGPPTKRLKMVFNPRGGGTSHYVEINGVSAGNFGFGAGFFNSAVRDEAHSGWWNPTMGGWVRHHGAPTTMTVAAGVVTTNKYIVPLFENQEFVFSRNNNQAPHDYPGAQEFLDPASDPEDHWSDKKYIDVGNNRDVDDPSLYRVGDEIDEDALGWDQKDEVQSEMCGQAYHIDFTIQMGIPAIRLRWLWAFERNARAMHQMPILADQIGQRFSGTVRDDAPDEDDLSGFALNGGCRLNDPEDGTLSYRFFGLSVVDVDGDVVLQPMQDQKSGPDTDRVFYYAWMDLQDPAYATISRSVDDKLLHPKFDEDWLANGTGGAGSLYLAIQVVGTTVTTITRGATTIITSSGWMPANGDRVYFALDRLIDPNTEPAQIVGPKFLVANVVGATFEIRTMANAAVNSTAWAAYTAGIIFGSPNDDRALGVYHPRSPAQRAPVEGWASSQDPDPQANRLRYRDNRRLQTSNKCTAKGAEARLGGQVYSTLRISGLYRRRNTGPYRNRIEVLYADRIYCRETANAIFGACSSMDSAMAAMVDATQPVEPST